mmetsp:Transcript_27729/g.73528  ORF Transcript_27729/g.73528 Transcript_27729/m.73528 type:complete len:271 (-) Transcript_27729:104-916(-)
MERWLGWLRPVISPAAHQWLLARHHGQLQHVGAQGHHGHLDGTRGDVLGGDEALGDAPSLCLLGRHEGGFHVAGVDDADANVVRPPVQGQAPREACHRVLGGRVRRGVCAGPVHCYAADVDDAAAPGRLHLLEGLASTQECTQHVHRHHLPERVTGQLNGGAAKHNAGAIHEQIARATLVQHALEQCHHALLVCDVRHHRHHTAMVRDARGGLPDVGRRLLQLLQPQVGYHYGRPLPDKLFRHGPAHAASAPSHDGGLRCQAAPAPRRAS